MTNESPLPRSVLLLTGVENGPYRYRVANLVEELKLLHVPATVRHHHDEEALQLAAEHELVIFQRVPWDDYASRVISRARNAGALPIFGIDDLLFDPAHPPPFLAGLGRQEAENWLQTVRAYQQVFESCDAFLGSTDMLAKAARDLGKPAFVHRNALSDELIAISGNVAQSRRSGEEVRLGYFSGTRTHARDFAQIVAPLARVMRARPQVRLHVVGALQLPRELERYASRIARAPVVPWRGLPELLAGVDVNLAPLEADERFCHAKSELKWFEAAIVGVPTVASPTEPFKFAIRDGSNGFLAGSEEEWERALLALVDSATLRARVGHAAKDDALRYYGPQASAQRLDTTIRALNALRPQRDLRGGLRISAMDLALLKASGLGIGRAATEPQDGIAGPDQLALREATHGIHGAFTAAQTFTAPAGALYRIDLLVGTHRRLNAHEIHLRLIDVASQAQLASAAVDATTACDNAWLAFEFAPVQLQAGTDVQVVVEAPAAANGEGLALWFEPSPGGKGRAGSRKGLDLTFRTFLCGPGWAPRVAPPEGDRRMDRLEKELAVARSQILSLQRDLAAVSRHVPGMERLRGTLPYKAARKIYRMIKA